MGASRRRWLNQSAPIPASHTPRHPGSSMAHAFGSLPSCLVQADDCLRQGIVIGITHTSHRRPRPRPPPTARYTGSRDTGCRGHCDESNQRYHAVPTKPVPAHPAPTSVRREPLTRQPTIRRANTSTTNATYNKARPGGHKCEIQPPITGSDGWRQSAGSPGQPAAAKSHHTPSSSALRLG